MLQHLRLVFALGLAACAAACSDDTNSSTSSDAGGPDGSRVAGGSSGKGSGGSSGTGGAAASGNGGATSATGGTPAGGTTRKGSGGASKGGGSYTDAGSHGASTGTGGSTAMPDAAPAGGGLHIEHVFVIAMENHDQSQIIGDVADAPYINNTLVRTYASTSNFTDSLPPAIPSEPHYVFLESGTNAFTDVTFTGDADPSAGNSTASTEHLVTQMKNAAPAISWMSYQEGLDAASGYCPIHTSGFYAPKHDPFVFFKDVAGSPPAADNAYCVAHHAPLTKLATSLTNDTVAAYNFITPNQCNDMHGQAGCPNSNTIRAGDDWLAQNIPPLVQYVNAHRGVIFVVWDEGVSTLNIPFLAIGPSVKKDYLSDVAYTHSSVVKTVERIFGLPYLDKVKGATDFADLFQPGRFP